MSLSNDQILDALLKYYQSRGMDLYYLLSDPVFDKAPVSDKVEFIKAHSSELLSGTSPRFTPSERGEIRNQTLANMVAGTGISAATLGSVIKKYHKPLEQAKGLGLPAAIAVAGGGLLVGSIVGGISGYVKAKSLKDRRSAIRAHLLAEVRNSSLPNQIGVLSSGGLHDIRSGPNARLMGMISDSAGKFMEKIVPSRTTPLFHKILMAENPGMNIPDFASNTD